MVSGPRGLAIDDQDRVWVLSAQAPQLRRFAADGKTSEVLVEEVVFEFPHQVTLDSKGTAYISDGYGKCLWKLAPGGKPEKWVQNGPLSNPIGIRFVKEHVLLIDPRAPGLFQADVAGKLTKLFPPEKP